MKADHTKSQSYKVKHRSGEAAFLEVGGAHKPGDRKSNINLREGRSPASVGVFIQEEGPVTARRLSPLAQRANKKVRVLQETLHAAAKKNPKRTFGILYDIGRSDARQEGCGDDHADAQAIDGPDRVEPGYRCGEPPI